MDTASLLSSQWSDLLSRLPASARLTALARSTGAFLRPREIRDVETLLRLCLWYGPGGLSLRSAAAMAGGSALANISDVGLLKRLSKSAGWLEALVADVLNERCGQRIESHRSLVLIDGPTVQGPSSVGTDWVLHTRYTPGLGFTGVKITDCHGGETLMRHTVRPGDIVVADRVYGRIKGLSHVINQGADFIVRAGWRALPLRDAQGGKLDLFALLEGLPAGQAVDLPVHVMVDGHHQPLRLVVRAKDDAATVAEGRRSARKAHKNKRKADPRTAVAARYMIVATSLAAKDYPATAVLDLYGARWQIEWAFKRLKSLLHIDRLRATRDLAKTWLFAHVLFALLIDNMTRQVLEISPCASCNERPQPALADLDMAPSGTANGAGS